MAEIVRLTRANQKISDQIDALIKQLDAKKSCSLALLQVLVASPAAELWVAQDEGSIVGMATLTLSRRIEGEAAWVEDVIIDESQRGKGLGKLLCQKMIERAMARGAYSLQLTSRREREIANKMYQKLGFELHDTNAYRLKL